MFNLELIKGIARPSPSKIVMVVIDGLGGLPHPESGKTELETARIPNLDSLAARGICGLSDPVAPGITPGSAPGHLALFGYDPIRCNIGRGILEAIGIGLELQPGDVAARGNFCTMDDKGLITDRRAGRIPTEKCTELCRLLNIKSIDGTQVLVYPVREHRFVAIFRGNNLVADVTESDPQQTGVPPLDIKPLNREASRLADIANKFIAQAKARLAEEHPANMVLLRGFSQHPQLPSMSEIYKLNPVAIAVYPMYRGLARLVGMQVVEAGTTLEDEIKALKNNFADYDFFFLHIKWTDSAGEDGDFDRKVIVLEQIDRALPGVINLEPDVLVVSGDHSTPAALGAHSWHPVPVALCAKNCRPDKVLEFSEAAFLYGGLGRLPATQIMPLAMANAQKLTKFGA
ncbi:MAG: phosphoglycerate mutase [Chloroflexi bacterium RBG_16_50_9]|nr:MAG: phosphoglycerate mutase [Chloroflexi bacterium RBG_16_50_9]